MPVWLLVYHKPLNLQIDFLKLHSLEPIRSTQNKYRILFCRHIMEGLDGTQFTCVACHPTDLCVVTGCQNGRIYYW